MADAGRLESRWPQQAARVVEWMHAHLPFTSSVTVETLAARARAFAGRRPAVRLGASIVDVLTTLLMAIYLLIDGRDAVHWATSPIPEPHRTRARRVLVQGARRMQRWVRGQGLLMLLHGGSAFVTFQLIGLPYADALGVFAAIANVIPFLGPILTLMAAGLVAATEAPDKLLGVVVFYLAYHNTESAWLQPRIMSSAVGVPGLTVIAALVLGNEIAGLAGMVFSVPTAVLIAELMKA
jgi:predicted PurR-regulated permease PerM